jgi:hypothetical protein
MAEAPLCKICNVRRAKRACPAVDGLICTICCGTERENSLRCPLDCPYLQEAHKREQPLAVSEREMAHPEVNVSEQYLADHEELLLFTIYSVLQGALRTDLAVDTDVLEALEASIQTYKTLESGLLYETRAENRVAAGVQRILAESIADYRKIQEEREGLRPLRDSEVLAILVFLKRIGQQNLNGRPKGRLFIDLLRHMTPDN